MCVRFLWTKFSFTIASITVATVKIFYSSWIRVVWVFDKFSNEIVYETKHRSIEIFKLEATLSLYVLLYFHPCVFVQILTYWSLRQSSVDGLFPFILRIPIRTILSNFQSYKILRISHEMKYIEECPWF